jgi:cell division protein FtsB
VDTRISLQPKPRRRQAILYGAIALILAALFADGIFGPHGFISSYRLKLQVRQAEQKTDQLNRENQGFANQVRQLKSDPSAIERVAREKMGLVKPGELVFKLPPKPATDPNVSSTNKTGASAPSNATTPAH